MISLRDVSKIYRRGSREVTALRGVNLDISQESFTVITGPSGSGKSTLLHLIGCLDRPSSGKVELHDSDLSQLSSDELAALRARCLGFVFQKFNLIPNLSALENTELPALLIGVSRSIARTRARRALERVELTERVGHKPSELSGGEQQRVALARALVNDPDIVLGDEPTGNLDTETGERVMLLLRGLREQGKTVLVVTHNPEVAILSNSVVFLRDGQRVNSLDRTSREA